MLGVLKIDSGSVVWTSLIKTKPYFCHWLDNEWWSFFEAVINWMLYCAVVKMWDLEETFLILWEQLCVFCWYNLQTIHFKLYWTIYLFCLQSEDPDASATENASNPGEPLAQSTPQKQSGGAAAGANGVEDVPSPGPVPNSFSTAPASVPSPVPVGQLVDIPLEGGGESMYEVSTL